MFLVSFLCVTTQVKHDMVICVLKLSTQLVQSLLIVSSVYSEHVSNIFFFDRGRHEIRANVSELIWN